MNIFSQTRYKTEECSKLETRFTILSPHSLLNCDVATHVEKMVLANLEFSTKNFMSHESIKDMSIQNICFEALSQKGMRREHGKTSIFGIFILFPLFILTHTIQAKFFNFWHKNCKKCPKFDVWFLRDVMIADDDIYRVNSEFVNDLESTMLLVKK